MFSVMQDYWLAFAGILIALCLGIAAVVLHQRRRSWLWQCYLPAVMFACYGLGAFGFSPWNWLGPTLVLTAFIAFVAALIVVIAKGLWSAPLGYGLVGLFNFGLGVWSGDAVAEGLRIAFLFIVSLRPQEPWWLLLLLAVPVLIWTSWHNLVTLGPTRRWLVLGLRCSLIVLLALALSEAFARKPNENVTVIFVWDRSLSMPPEFDRGKDLREGRILQFINESVANNKKRDNRVGVIVFGKDPWLELPPHSVPKLGFKRVLSQIDPTYTDIAAALKLALASFPEGSGKRIVLISDGNENRGRAEEIARIARQNGVQIDIVTIAAGRKIQNEILIERLEAPATSEKGARLPMRVAIRSFSPHVVVANVTLRKITFDAREDDKDQASSSKIVKLRQGLNYYFFQREGAAEETAFAYEAKVVPLHVESDRGVILQQGLPGDRIDNNDARVTVMSRGQRTVLLLETERGKHQLLVDRLRTLKSGLKVRTLTIKADADPDKGERNVNELHQLTKGDPETFATYLSKFDAVILANLPAECLNEDEQKVIRSQVHDQGAGLVMIGGNQSFGAGGWQNTEVEKALPVNMELKSMKIDGKSGLVLIMHASEIPEGNAWQRKIAKLALEKLSEMDMVGQIHFDHGFQGGKQGHRWHIPFQPIAGNRARLLRLVDSMEPGDMPDVDPAFVLAHKELTRPDYGLATKHIILISDGDHWKASRQMLDKLRSAGITCTTVCITSHGQAEIDNMKAVAQVTKGRWYHVQDAKELPAIYVRETRLVSQSFVHQDNKGFGSNVTSREGPTEGIANRPPLLYGFVRTTPKESSLVKVLIESDKIGPYKFPILAAWQYGLGKSVAFTSDARTGPANPPSWDRDWANSDIHARFWEQTLDWVLRPSETGKHLFLATEHKDGKIRITVEAREENKLPLTDIDLKAGITSPSLKVKEDKKFDLKFEQTNAGVYVAEIPADNVGAYFINIQAFKKDTKEMIDSVRAGVTIPYSPEFAETESNPGLLEKIRDLTGGKAYRDNAAELEKAARDAEVFRATPQSHASLQALWPWLVFFTAICLLLDVAIRRIAIQPEMLWAKAVAQWERLRRREVAEESTTAFIERLKSRKAEVGATMDRQKAAVKFEAAASAKPLETPTVAAAPPVEKPKPAPVMQPEAEEDFATRLMRAKKKAMEERENK